MFSTVSVSGLWCVWTSYYSSHECWFKMIGDRRMTPTGWWFQIHDSFMSNHRNRMNIPNNDFWNSFFFCRAAETTIKPTHKLLFTVPEPRPWSHRRSMPLQSIVQKARGWREFLVTFQRELDGEHVSQHFTHVITCYECASSHALVTFTRLYLHVSFMGFSWGKCRTRHG